MNRIILIVIAVAVVAGAFPTQAYQVVDQMNAWLNSAMKILTPSQQMAIIIGALLFVLVSNSR